MKYGKYIDSKTKKEWAEHYIEYKALKDLIKECQKEAEIAGETSFSPRTTSLTVQRYANQKDSFHEKFFRKLELDVSLEARMCPSTVAVVCVAQCIFPRCHACILMASLNGRSQVQTTSCGCSFVHKASQSLEATVPVSSQAVSWCT